jgi:ankyrin repeat protein
MALTSAAQNGHLEVVELLVQAGADTEKVDEVTMLHPNVAEDNYS